MEPKQREKLHIIETNSSFIFFKKKNNDLAFFDRNFHNICRSRSICIKICTYLFNTDFEVFQHGFLN